MGVVIQRVLFFLCVVMVCIGSVWDVVCVFANFGVLLF